MTTSIKLECKCKVTAHRPAGRHGAPHEMLLPANMCDEHRTSYEAFHAASMTERAQARAALETGPSDASARLRVTPVDGEVKQK